MSLKGVCLNDGVRSMHEKLIDKKGYKYFLQTGESGSCANLTQFCGLSKDELKVGCLGNISETLGVSL